MSLLRQLMLIVLIVFLIAFTGTLFISVNTTRVYLEEQMQSHAQDTATSLALSLVPPLKKKDWTTVSSMVDAIFDHGYYREVIMRSKEGKVLLERTAPVKVETVPQWFMRMVPLETPKGEAVLTAGWSQIGTVVVRSHPGYAYHRLWKSAVAMLGWFTISWAIAAGLLVLILRYMLQPLRAVEQQALAVGNREFPVLEELPRTRELHRVVVAMNKMSTKVKDLIDDQVRLTERIREEAYTDAVTGLSSRRWFEQRLSYFLSKPDEFLPGALMLVQLNNFKKYNEQHGYVAGDELLKHAAQLLKKACGGSANRIIARLSGADFAVALPGVSISDATALGEAVVGELAQLRSRELVDTHLIGHAGIAYSEAGVQAGELISQADMALRAAQSKGPNTWYLYERAALGKRAVPGRMQWHEILKQAISEGRLALLYQPVFSCATQSPLHYEALARIPAEDGTLMPASMFLSTAERMDLAHAFDKLVIEEVFATLRERPPQGGSIAVNVSPTSLHDAEFCDWLCELLHNTSEGIRRRLIFESNEFGCTAKPELLRQFVDRLTHAGGKFALDHFGLGFGSFGYLRGMKLEYIKIDGSFIHHLHEHRDNQFFVHALAEIAHGLDIKVIAESVEQQQEWDIVKELHLDGGQGYALGEPRPME